MWKTPKKLEKKYWYTWYMHLHYLRNIYLKDALFRQKFHHKYVQPSTIVRKRELCANITDSSFKNPPLKKHKRNVDEFYELIGKICFYTEQELNGFFMSTRTSINLSNGRATHRSGIMLIAAVN